MIPLIEDFRKSKLRKSTKEHEEMERRVIKLGKDYKELEKYDFFIEKETILSDPFLKVDET